MTHGAGLLRSLGRWRPSWLRWRDLRGPRAACPPRGRPTSVLFICCFNLLSVFTSLFREGAAAASSCRLSVCVRVCVCVCLGQGGVRGRGAKDGAVGVPGGRPVGAAPATTVNFKEFLQDIFINFVFLVLFGKGCVGAAGQGEALCSGLGSWFFL